MKNKTLEQKRETELFHQVQILDGNVFGTGYELEDLSELKMDEWNERHPDLTYNYDDIEKKRKSIKSKESGKKVWHNRNAYDPRDNKK